MVGTAKQNDLLDKITQSQPIAKAEHLYDYIIGFVVAAISGVAGYCIVRKVKR
jgi:hypothetical protein